jgi:hypothetical protein
MHRGNEAACAVPIERRNLADIGAADKGAFAGAAKDDKPELRILGEPRGGSIISAISPRLRLFNFAGLSIVSQARRPPSPHS